MNDRPADEWGSVPTPRRTPTPPLPNPPVEGTEGATPLPAGPRVYDRTKLARPVTPSPDRTRPELVEGPVGRPAEGPRVGASIQPFSQSGGRSAGVPRPADQTASRRRGGCCAILLPMLLGVALALLAVGGAFIAYASIAAGLPAPDELQARASQFNSTLIYDREGGLLNEVADPNYGRRTAVSLNAISPYLTSATIATEDPNFYEHPGVDPIGILRGIYHAVKYRDLETTPGGSTITQQLVKLTFLTPERSLTRKIKEAILAAEITRRYPKDRILEIYLNEIYYGNLAYGIEAAAETYFDKRASDLTLAEAALLAGLPQAPAYYDPYTRLWDAATQGEAAAPGAVKRRQAAVLGLMAKRGYITTAEADAAWQEPITLKPLRQTYTSKNPHFVLYARSQAEQALGPELLAKGGLRIHTTLDPRIQAIAEDEVAKQVKALASQGARNGALIAVQPKTGEILAMVGSADFYSETISGQINMAIVPRQPGSAIKPFTYLAAFEMPAAVSQGGGDKSAPPGISAIEPPGYWTPATALMDIRTEFPDGARPPYVPVNYDEREHGLVTVRAALANSYNIPAVKTLEHIGLERLKEMARRVGISTLTRPDYGLSLTLGGGEVTLLEMTGAYAVLANGGVRAPLSPIACVLDADGKLIWRGSGSETVAACKAAQPSPARVLTPAPAQPVLNPQHVYLMTSILSDVEARRPMFGRSAELLSLNDRPAAAKTGTTNDYRDAWTVGYTPDLAVGAWVGNADYKPMQKVAGSIGAAPIWHNVVQRSLQGRPAQRFGEPPGIQHLRVCADTGTLPGEACPAQREELFAAGQGPLPAQYDLHQRVRVDKITGRLASAFTPADRVEERNVMLFPPRYRAWAEAHGIPQPELEAPTYAFTPELRLDGPENGAQVTGNTPIMGRVHLPAPLQWRVEYGVGPNPIGWGTVTGPHQGDREGSLAEWDTTAPVTAHGAQDFSIRLAAYDPAIPDYPVAASNVAYVTVVVPTATPTSPPTATRTQTATPTRQATATPSRTPPAAPVSTATPTRTPPAATATATRTASPVTDQPPSATPTLPPQAATATVAATAAASATPPPAASPTATPTRPAQAAGENTLRAALAHPSGDSQIVGAVEVQGTADGTEFAAYQLEFATGVQPPADGWQQMGVSQLTPVTEGLLGIWETQGLAPGAYWLRLEVFDNAGGVARTQTRVEVVR